MSVKDKDAKILGEARQGTKSAKTSEAAKKLGAKGGNVGGLARAKKLSPQRREAIASKGADVRWSKK
jgi:hypothetical protein